MVSGNTAVNGACDGMYNHFQAKEQSSRTSLGFNPQTTINLSPRRALAPKGGVMSEYYSTCYTNLLIVYSYGLLAVPCHNLSS